MQLTAHVSLINERSSVDSSGSAVPDFEGRDHWRAARDGADVPSALVKIELQAVGQSNLEIEHLIEVTVHRDLAVAECVHGRIENFRASAIMLYFGVVPGQNLIEDDGAECCGAIPPP